MSQSLSNLCNISLPLTFERTSATATANGSRFPQPSRVLYKCSGVKAMAADGRDSLDHLQRASRHQPQRRRSPQVAPLGLWDRFPTARTVQQMMETMERMVEDPFAYSSGGWPSERGSYSRGRTPWDIKEGPGEYKMRFDMPGMTKDDVKVWVEEKMLVIKAEKKGAEGNDGDQGEEEEEGTWTAKSYGSYNSRVALPDNVQFEKIKAVVKDGVLYVTIPKAGDNPKIMDVHVD